EAILSYQHGIPLVAMETTGGWAERLKTAALDGGQHLDQRRLMTINYAREAAEAVDRAFALIGTVPPPSKI
ncbi:MAG: TIGR00725 family protein, partial [Hyphomicrobiales bacterium]|nr:TIGR00725 family protein [Hyphomicrobiales bacterium]